MQWNCKRYSAEAYRSNQLLWFWAKSNWLFLLFQNRKIPHPPEYGCRDSFKNTSNVETPINFLNFFLVMMFGIRFKEERNSQDETSKTQNNCSSLRAFFHSLFSLHVKLPETEWAQNWIKHKFTTRISK